MDPSEENNREQSPYLGRWEEEGKALFIVQKLVWSTAILSILDLALPEISPYPNATYSLRNYLGISLDGIESLGLWRFFTYSLLEGSSFPGSSFLSLAFLFFNLYFLWSIGSALSVYLGIKRFLSLYFGIGVISGVAVLAVQYFNQDHDTYIGNLAPLSGLLLIWSMLRPEGELLLFFSMQVRSRSFVLALFFFQAAIFIFGENWTYLVALGSGIMTAYLYGIISLRVRGPFAFFYPLEERLRFFHTIWRYKQRHSQSRIYDKETGKTFFAPDEELFVDLILDKISKYGEESLTWNERRRMQQIAKKKRDERIDRINNH
jgi:membrane associated rhomboid family serine protease